MKLTRQQAIDKSIELWKWLAETGKEKEDYPWPRGKQPIDGCYLCEYALQVEDREDGEDACSYCPLAINDLNCGTGNYYDWDDARTSTDRKKYAALFLEELKALQEEK